MTIPIDLERTDAHDDYTRYYAEKLWEWIPEYYRDADLKAARPHVLRALIEVIAGDAATARRSIDRLWEDVLIDYADDWAIPYIGDLLGTRMLSALNARGRRNDVANTLSYRRRAGTPVVVESLVRDITGWSGALCEAFKRLHRHWHELDCPEQGRLESRRYATPRHGYANLRAQRIAERIDTAFDQYAHHADFRRHRGYRGRYAVPKLNLHLYRQKPVEIEAAKGCALDAHLFTFDPSGRDIQLFSNNARQSEVAWEPARAWHMPAPISRAQLNHAMFDLSRVESFGPFGPGLASMADANIEGVRRLLSLCGSPTASDFRKLQRDTIEERCAKTQHMRHDLSIEAADSVAGLDPREPEEIMAANLEYADDLPTFITGVRAYVDPQCGRALLNANTHFRAARYYYGQFDHVGAGGYDRAASIAQGLSSLPNTPPNDGPIVIQTADRTDNDEFQDSYSYRLDHDIEDFTDLRLQSRNRERPYVELHDAGGREALLVPADTDTTLEDNDPANRRTIEINGLWLSVGGSVPATQTLSAPSDAATPVPSTIVIDARKAPIKRACLHHVTLDPGGERGRLRPCEVVPIPYVRLLVKGQVDELVIDRSIVGMIEEDAAAEDPCSIGRLILRDSIVQSIDPAIPAIDLKSGRLEARRSTIFGDVNVARIDASEVLVDGTVRVIDTQNGCFRFSATSAGPTVRLPAQFESHLYEGGLPSAMFVSSRFGDAGYAQLSINAPSEIVSGGENRSEIGVFNRTLAPLKMRDLATKLDEYTPLNTVTQLVIET